ncbi:nuclear transport factor 2 family protein [Virgisporangium aurantiacum]|uniref:Ketosteroid isomerase n=1 Tax=Virgisporangium aurantiacum TaxID=175570 RepID=A0A8J3ZB42_9ACTN|nr:nuclear transport factor 2 family protein [Virgisporangium aurantiacum]GIJ60719.1 ketosteroid isomerase [Virgisporangium aurantiacum]
MSDETRAVVADLMGRIVAGDPERVAELFAEPVDWLLSWPEPAELPSDVPWIRPRRTRADVADHFRTLAEHHVPELNGTTVSDVLVDGTDAVVVGEIVQTVRRTGVAYRSPFALRLTVEGGLITRYHIYEDSLTVARSV